MTTIICTKKAMIADRQTTKGSMKYKSPGKIKRIGESIVGLAGNLDSIWAVWEWFDQGAQGEFPKTEDINGIVLNKEGIFEFYTNGKLIPIAMPFHAVGSGAELAIGAMEAGADIHGAMKIALKRDAWTGFGTTYLELE